MKRIVAIAFIFLCTSIAWFILGSTIFVRSNEQGSLLSGSVESTWGGRQTQVPPTIHLLIPQKLKKEEYKNGKLVSWEEDYNDKQLVELDSSRIAADLKLEHRQKGLMWYSTYKVDFKGAYTFANPLPKPHKAEFLLKYPASKAIYDDLTLLLDGQPVDFQSTAAGITFAAELAGKSQHSLAFSYRSQGLDEWNYSLGNEVSKVKDFQLRVNTDFKDIDFPDETLSPSSKSPTATGWQLDWNYRNLISGYDIAVEIPEKLQPGPLAGQISYFAPVSLLFFFFIIFIITSLRGIDLHPLNYFFLATAFFAFHLLMAYLVDHISIHLAFAICSAVSIFLVVSYLRLVVSMRFAAVEAGISQFIYLVLFSYAFFFKGFTGLAITIGAILTLFAVMQMTGKIDWEKRYQTKKPVTV